MPRVNDHFEMQPSPSRSEQIVPILALPNQETICGNRNQSGEVARSHSESLSRIIESSQTEVGRLQCLVVELLIKNEELRNKHSQRKMVLDVRSEDS
jgi:hypothetical protein